MTYPLDHNQQYFAYLQAWRQLLEPLLTMAPAMPHPPGTPWGMPPMPPYPQAAPLMPPTAPAAPLSPPMPTDYAQQLFGQLQTWRQYLEQMTGARPGPAQPSGPWPVEGGPAREGRQPGGSTVPVEPDDPNAGKIRDATAASNSSSEPSWPPPKVDVRPINELGGQDPFHPRHPIRPDNEGGSIHVDPGLFNQAALARGQQIGTPPTSEGAKYGPVRYGRNPSSATMPQARRAAASPVSAATRQVSSSAPMQAPQQSRFKGLAERANSLGGG